MYDIVYRIHRVYDVKLFRKCMPYKRVYVSVCMLEDVYCNKSNQTLVDYTITAVCICDIKCIMSIRCVIVYIEMCISEC